MARNHKGPEDGPHSQGPSVLSGVSGGQLGLPHRTGALLHSSGSIFGSTGGSCAPQSARSGAEPGRSFLAYGPPRSKYHGSQSQVATHLGPVYSTDGPRKSAVPSAHYDPVLAQSLLPTVPRPPPPRPRPRTPATSTLPRPQASAVEDSVPEYSSSTSFALRPGSIARADVDAMRSDLYHSQSNQLTLGAQFDLSEDGYNAPKQPSSATARTPNEYSFLRTYPAASNADIDECTPRRVATAGASMGLPATPSRSRSTVPTSTPKSVHIPRRASSQRPEGHIEAFGNSQHHPQTSPLLPRSHSASPAPSECKDFPTKLGRLTREESELLQAAVLQSHSILKKACDSISRPLDIGINRFNSTMLSTARTRALKTRHTGWNLYTALFHTAPYEEAKRLGISYSSNIKVTDAMFQSYKVHYGNLWMEYLIAHYDITTTTNKTIAERERGHEKVIKQVRLALEGAEQEFGFQFVLISSGSSVNEDQSIGSYYATKYLHGFPEKRLKMSCDDLIGHVKTHAYDLVSEQHALQAAAERKAEVNAKAEPTNFSSSGSSAISEPIGTDNAKQLNSSTINVSRSGVYHTKQWAIPISASPTTTATKVGPKPDEPIYFAGTKPIASSLHQAIHIDGAQPTASSSRLPLGAHLKPNPAAQPNAVLSAIVNLSDDEIRMAVRALNEPDFIQIVDNLLSVNRTEVKMGVDAAHTFIKNWMTMSFKLLGVQRKTDGYFDWAKLPAKFAKEGLVLVGWLHGVPFPGEPVKGKPQEGIRALKAEQSRKVVRGFRSGTLGIERRSKDQAALSASALPIYYGEAPLATSPDLLGRRYYANGTFDSLGLSRQGARKGAHKSQDLGNGVRNTEEVKPARTCKSVSTATKRKGKSRAANISYSDHDSDHDYDDEASRPPTSKLEGSVLSSVTVQEIEVGRKQVFDVDKDSDGNIRPHPSKEAPTPSIRGQKQAKNNTTAWQNDESGTFSPSPTGPQGSAATCPTMVAVDHADSTAIDSSSSTRGNTPALPSAFAASPISSTASGSSSTSSFLRPPTARPGKRKATRDLSRSVGRDDNAEKRIRLTAEAIATSSGPPSSLVGSTHPSNTSAPQIFADRFAAPPQASTAMSLGANFVAVVNAAPLPSDIASGGPAPSRVGNRGLVPGYRIANVIHAPSRIGPTSHDANVSMNVGAAPSHPMNFGPGSSQPESSTAAGSHNYDAEWLHEQEQEHIHDQYVQQQYKPEQQRRRAYHSYEGHPQPHQQFPRPYAQYPQAQHQQQHHGLWRATTNNNPRG